jgi:hypothetical protein
MSPLHQHYQKKGFHENKIAVRFWIVTILLVVGSIITLKIRSNKSKRACKKSRISFKKSKTGKKKSRKTGKKSRIFKKKSKERS